MKTISILPLVVLSAVGCAATGTADHQMPIRGAVHVVGVAQKAVVAGPTSIHVYSEFAGGQVYTVPAVTGTDGDCRAPERATEPAVAINADRVMTVDVAAGQLACLGTNTNRRFELLWHVNSNAASVPLLVAQRR